MIFFGGVGSIVTIKKIISGGQTGADQAGLNAAMKVVSTFRI